MPMRLRTCVALSLAWASLTLTLSAEQQAQSSPAQFEAASIRQSVSDGPSFLTTKGDRFTATNFSLRLLILNAGVTTNRNSSCLERSSSSGGFAVSGAEFQLVPIRGSGVPVLTYASTRSG
jgi:hypothetical protein